MYQPNMPAAQTRATLNALKAMTWRVDAGRGGGAPNRSIKGIAGDKWVVSTRPGLFRSEEIDAADERRVSSGVGGLGWPFCPPLCKSGDRSDGPVPAPFCKSSRLVGDTSSCAAGCFVVSSDKVKPR